MISTVHPAELELRAARDALNEITDLIAGCAFDSSRGAFIVPGADVTAWMMNHAKALNRVRGATVVAAVPPRPALRVVTTGVLTSGPGDAA